MKLLSFGEIIWDVYGREKFIGGAPLNFAAHAKRAGADAYLLSAVGNDELGREALGWVEHYGINGSLISESQCQTGQCRVTLDENRVPKYDIITDTAYDDIEIPKNIGEYNFDALALGTLALRGEHNRRVLKEIVSNGGFKEIFADLNIRPPFDYKESIILALGSATILKVSDEELPSVMISVFGGYTDMEKSVHRFVDEFPNIKLVLVTCGGEPSFAYDIKNGKKYTCDSVKTEVVSTVGAGDSYGATFLTNYINGKSIPECMSEAARVSAFVVSRAGAIPEE